MTQFTPHGEHAGRTYRYCTGRDVRISWNDASDGDVALIEVQLGPEGARNVQLPGTYRIGNFGPDKWITVGSATGCRDYARTAVELMMPVSFITLSRIQQLLESYMIRMTLK